MPYAPEHKENTRNRILASARKLFNRRGFTEVSIDEVMAGAGLTRGGFYAHFQNKEELYAEAVTYILVDHPSQNWEGVNLDLDGEALAGAVVRAYLGDQHYADIEGSCPLIALPGDVARSGGAVKRAFRDVLSSMLAMFEYGRSETELSAETRKRDAYAIAALCVGGMTLARGVDDEDLANEIRAACTETALRLGGWKSDSVS